MGQRNLASSLKNISLQFVMLFVVSVLAIYIDIVNASKIPRGHFTLHDKKGFQGDRVFVNLEGCQNLHSFNKKVSSVSTKEKGTCIRLHAEFGCHGRHLDVGSLDALCADNLARCVFNDLASSVSSCDYKLETSPDSNGIDPSDTANHLLTTRGELCKSPCSMDDNVNYFWCYTDLMKKSWDYCSPKPDVDYYGNICSSACAHEGYSYAWCTCKNCKYTSRRKGWKDSWGYCSISPSNENHY